MDFFRNLAAFAIMYSPLKISNAILCMKYYESEIQYITTFTNSLLVEEGER